MIGKILLNRRTYISSPWTLRKRFIRFLCPLLLVLCALGATLRLNAQVPPSPSDGLILPDRSITTQTDAASIEVNPAGLGFMRTAELSYGFSLPSGDFSGVLPEGHALFMGLGVGPFGAGFGLQWLDTPALGAQLQRYQKYSLSSAFSIPRVASFGATANFFGSTQSERLNDMISWDIGMQWRLTSNLGLGFMARDVNNPFLSPDNALPTRLAAGLAIRGWEGRFVIDSEFSTVSGEEAATLSPRILIEAMRGLRIFGRTDFALDWSDDSLQSDWRMFSGGVELSVGSYGIQSAVAFDTDSQEANNGTSFARQSHLLWLSPNKQRSLVDRKNRWIEINLQQSIAEQAISRILGSDTRSFRSLIDELDAIAEDTRVDGVVFSVGNTTLGYAQLWELRRFITRLNDSGKHTISYLNTTNTKDVFVATATDEVWVAPGTLLFPTGISSQFLFYSELLNKIGVEAEFLRISEYKTAPEPYLRTSPSDESIEQRNAFLDLLWEELIQSISGQTQISREDAIAMFDNIPWMPDEARDRGFIHRIGYEDEFKRSLQSRYGVPGRLERGYRKVEYSDERWGLKPQIAVVHIDGVIIDGLSGRAPLSGETVTGSDTVIRVLRGLGDDPRVRAIVIRIDSPGGSAQASDLIFREVRRLSQRKPVIASMGNVAASGGYYVAAGASEIFAAPTTLTGSIGIFAGKINISRLTDSIGVDYHDVSRGQRAGIYNVFQPWTDDEREGIENAINYLYQLFLHQVAQTRPLSVEEIDRLGRGRIWSGKQAEEVGLVDQIGGLSDAIRRAESLANLERGEANISSYPGTISLLGGPFLSGTTGDFIAQQHATYFAAHTPAHQMRLQYQWQRLLKLTESTLYWPLLFRNGEAIMMPEYMLMLD